MAERSEGKIPPGLYLRDIAEIREGAESFQFTENKIPPRNVHNCLSLVGSERTISLELPSKVLSVSLFFNTCWCTYFITLYCTLMKFTRDWFLTRFRLLAEDILVDQERMTRKFKIWEKARQLTAEETQSVAKLQALLDRGIQVKHHDVHGNISDAVLRYAAVSNDLQLYSKQEGFFLTKESMMVQAVLVTFFFLCIFSLPV
jgi:hypothetical protein